MSTQDHEGRTVVTYNFKDGGIRLETYQKPDKETTRELVTGFIEFYKDELLDLAYQLISHSTGIDIDWIEESLGAEIQNLIDAKNENEKLEAIFVGNVAPGLNARMTVKIDQNPKKVV